MQSFGPYTNLVEIGNGGMATVYRATAPSGNLVALKVLAFNLAADSTARLRFEQESNLGLVHPNIVRIVDHGIEYGAPFIVMDYVVGESLDRRLTRAGPLAPQELAPILRDAALALDYAHEHKIIHRDVKPSNILIRTNGQALLADFGVAKSASLTAYTATAARVGSVFYMSPEQAIGTLEITRATDIYSLGVTAYYALTGRHPFEADNEIAIARMHIDVKPRHVSDVNPNIPRNVGAVVMQALEKDPARRPASAGAFAQAFQQATRATRLPRYAGYRFKPFIITITVTLCLVAMPILLLRSDIPSMLFVDANAMLTPSSTIAAMAVPFPTGTTPNQPALTSATQTPASLSAGLPEENTATTTSTATSTSTATTTATKAPSPAPAPTRRTVRLPSAPTATRRPPPPPRTRTPTATATEVLPPVVTTVVTEPSATITTAPSSTSEPLPTSTPVDVTSTTAPPTQSPPTSTPVDAISTPVPTTQPPPTEAPTSITAPTTAPTTAPPTPPPPAPTIAPTIAPPPTVAPSAIP